MTHGLPSPGPAERHTGAALKAGYSPPCSTSRVEPDRCQAWPKDGQRPLKPTRHAKETCKAVLRYCGEQRALEPPARKSAMEDQVADTRGGLVGHIRPDPFARRACSS